MSYPCQRKKFQFSIILFLKGITVACKNLNYWIYNQIWHGEIMLARTWTDMDAAEFLPSNKYQSLSIMNYHAIQYCWVLTDR